MNGPTLRGTPNQKWENLVKTQLAALLSALSVTSLASLASAGGAGGLNVRYICAGNIRIQATYTGQHVRVIVGGRVLEMNASIAASGERYVGGGLTWWTKGHTAELYRGEIPGKLTSLHQCQQT